MKSLNPNEFPKILVISNNPFSKTSNNGKTLASFFKEMPSKNIAQLYFSSEQPNDENFENYFRVSDAQILKSLFSFKKAGEIVPIAAEKIISDTKVSNIHSSDVIVKSNFFRLIRELFWKSKKWESDGLIKWLENFAPDIVFFCAGDSGFAYDITFFVLSISKAKLVTYITDDYILPRQKSSLFWQLRRKIVFLKMKKSIMRSDLFITISEEMRAIYYEIFGKDSIIALNMSSSMKIDEFVNNRKNDIIKLIYTGGLHFKRYETLQLLAEAISKYNNSQGKIKAYLNIYSNTTPSNKILKKLNIHDASEFSGGLNNELLKLKLNEADIPVHVESFDLRSIESTRLSISTKIPEYLSLDKPILAIGPKELASMKLIDDVAFCIGKKDSIYNELCKFLEDEHIQEDKKKNSTKLYLEKYQHKSIKELTQNIIDLR